MKGTVEGDEDGMKTWITYKRRETTCVSSVEISDSEEIFQIVILSQHCVLE